MSTFQECSEDVMFKNLLVRVKHVKVTLNKCKIIILVGVCTEMRYSATDTESHGVEMNGVTETNSKNYSVHSQTFKSFLRTVYKTLFSISVFCLRHKTSKCFSVEIYVRLYRIIIIIIIIKKKNGAKKLGFG